MIQISRRLGRTSWRCRSFFVSSGSTSSRAGARQTIFFPSQEKNAPPSYPGASVSRFTSEPSRFIE